MPSVLNWDIFEHQTVINQIRAGQWAILPSSLTDTFRFDGYTTLFHTILAGAQSVLPIDPLTFWWDAELIHFLITVLASTYITRVFLNQPLAGLIGGLLGATIFESQVAYTNLFLLPQTISATLGVLGITLLIGSGNKIWRKIIAALLILSSTLFHFIIGGFVLALAIISQLIKNTNRYQLAQLTIALVLLIPTAAYMLATTTQLGAINYGEAEVFTHTLAQKLQYALQWYGPFLTLIPLGVVMAIWSQSHRTRMLGLVAALSLATIVAPFPYVLKFATVGRFFLNIALTIVLLWIIRSMHARWTKIVAIGVIAVSLTFVFIQNIRLWKAPLLRDGQASEISKAEYDASRYLQKTISIYSDRVMLLSDPATQYILEATSGIDTQGGAYATNATRDRAAAAIQGQLERNTLVVFSGRYFRWLEHPEDRNNISFNIWRPEGLTLNDYVKISEFETQTGLSPIYKNSDLVIYYL